MKNILRKFIILTFFLIGMTLMSNASVTIHLKVSITDSCLSTWTGDYCAHIYVTFGTNHYCTHTICGLQAGGVVNDIQYQCDIPPNDTNKDYDIYVTVCRDVNPPTCCASWYSPPLFYYQLSSVYAFSLTLH
jgi:hypothetical protein